MGERVRGGAAVTMNRTDQSWADAHAIMAELAANPELRQRGWDSYDAQPLDEATVQRAKVAMRALEGAGIPAPMVFPFSAGGIELQWDRGYAPGGAWRFHPGDTVDELSIEWGNVPADQWVLTPRQWVMIVQLAYGGW